MYKKAHMIFRAVNCVVISTHRCYLVFQQDTLLSALGCGTGGLEAQQPDCRERN